MKEQDEASFKEIKSLILLMQDKMRDHLPGLKKEVKLLIDNKSTNQQDIERTLDMLLNLTQLGIAEDVFIDLIRYYKTVNSEEADFYWGEYNREDD